MNLEELKKLCLLNGDVPISVLVSIGVAARTYLPKLIAVAEAAKDHECAPGDLPDCPICKALAARSVEGVGGRMRNILFVPYCVYHPDLKIEPCMYVENSRTHLVDKDGNVHHYQTSKAARLALVQTLISPRVEQNDDGDVIAEYPPLLTLTAEQVKELLDV